MSSNASTNSRTSSEESLPDSLLNLKPYYWEPRRSTSEVAELMKKLASNSKTEDSDEDAEDRQYRLVSVWELHAYGHIHRKFVLCRDK